MHHHLPMLWARMHVIGCRCAGVFTANILIGAMRVVVFEFGCLLDDEDDTTASAVFFVCHISPLTCHDWLTFYLVSCCSRL
jgi:hypothetical protein